MELLGGSYGETKLVFEKGGFPSLAKLTLNNLKQLKELRLNPESVPVLTVLTQCGCENVKLKDNRKPPDSGGSRDLIFYPGGHLDGWSRSLDRPAIVADGKRAEKIHGDGSQSLSHADPFPITAVTGEKDQKYFVRTYSL